jgi:hypothetical protein
MPFDIIDRLFAIHVWILKEDQMFQYIDQDVQVNKQQMVLLTVIDIFVLYQEHLVHDNIQIYF